MSATTATKQSKLYEGEMNENIKGLSTRIRIVIRVEVEFLIFAFNSNQSCPNVLLHNANSVMTIKFTM